MFNQHGTLEISRSRLKQNLAALRARIGARSKLCATIKADAYGHGTTLLSPLLREQGVQWACVYSLREAAEMGALGWEGVLALAPFVARGGLDAKSKIFLNGALSGAVRVNVTDMDSARVLSTFALHELPRPVPVHVQVDAGLTRIGVEPREVEDLADLIRTLPGLKLEGIFAHFSHGDVPQHGTIDQQLALLHQVADPLKADDPSLMIHLQNSGGTWHVGDAGLDMVRIGIALYGLQPSMSDPIDDLLPIARVVAPILAIHDRPAGTGVGYGHTYVTKRPSRLAVVPVGYAEGYPRLLSNRSVAQIRSTQVPVVGRVSMDQIILDVTDVPEASLGDEVSVISWNPTDANCLDRMAEEIGTIGYELATHLGSRLERRVVE